MTDEEIAVLSEIVKEFRNLNGTLKEIRDKLFDIDDSIVLLAKTE
jgi:hypothetical protein